MRTLGNVCLGVGVFLLGAVILSVVGPALQNIGVRISASVISPTKTFLAGTILVVVGEALRRRTRLRR